MSDHLASKPFSEMIRAFASGSVMQESAPDTVTILQERPSRSKRSRPRPEPERQQTSIYYDEDELAALSDELTLESIRSSSPSGEVEDIPYLSDFDELIEAAFSLDEDVTFRNNLISMGRKYAIKGQEDPGDTSEVTKAFAKQEQEIDMLLQDYARADLEIQKDIEFIRAMRTKNYKALADLQAVRASYFSGKLSAIKEKNSMVKSKYDITTKIKALNGDQSDSSTAASRAIQQMFSMGRTTLRPAIDPGSSGAEFDEPMSQRTSYDEENLAETAIELARGLPAPSSDGDKFIAYEKDGVEWVLDIGEDGTERNIYAINSAGDVVPDYPLPNDDPSNLQFNFNEMNGTATDQLQRIYRLRKNGVDVFKDE